MKVNRVGRVVITPENVEIVDFDISLSVEDGLTMTPELMKLFTAIVLEWAANRLLDEIRGCRSVTTGLPTPAARWN